MRLEFTFTADDLAEAHVAASHGPAGATGTVRRIGSGAVLAMIAVALAVLVYYQLQPDPPLNGPPPASELLPRVAPWFVFFAVIISHILGPFFRQTRGRRAGSFLHPAGDAEHNEPRAGLAPPRPWVLYAVLAAIGTSMVVGVYAGWRNRVAAGASRVSRPACSALCSRS